MKRVPRFNHLNVYIIAVGMLTIATIFALALLILTEGQITQSLRFAILFLIPFTVFSFLCYPITTHKILVKDGYMLLGSEIVNSNHLKEAYVLSPFQKLLISLFQKKHMYANFIANQGLLLRSESNSYYIIDYIKIPPVTPVMPIKGLTKNKLANYIFLLAIPVIPLLLVALAIKFKETMLTLSLLLFVVYVLEILGAYYIPFLFCNKLKLDEIGVDMLSDEGLKEDLKNVILLKGAIVNALPGRIVNGITLNLYFRKYIILNLSIVEHPDEDVRKYVFYHELGHAKMNHGAFYPFITPLLIIFMLLSPMLPSTPLPDYLPSYTGLILVLLLISLAVLLRHKMQKNELWADVFATDRMSLERVIRVLKQFIVSEVPGIFWFGYLSSEQRIAKLKRMR